MESQTPMCSSLNFTNSWLVVVYLYPVPFPYPTLLDYFELNPRHRIVLCSDISIHISKTGYIKHNHYTMITSKSLHNYWIITKCPVSVKTPLIASQSSLPVLNQDSK
jgi:hypothetical protein